MVYLPRLVIVCPSQIRADWENTQIGDLFDGDNLSLRIQPESYTRIEEGEKSKFIDYFSGVGYNQSPVRIGFNVAVIDSRDELAIALSELSRLSLGTKLTDFQPVTVYDYARVENKADYVRGYTIRTGQIWIDNLTATVQKGTLICGNPAVENPVAGRYNNGFTLKFLSLNKEVKN